MTPSNLPLNPNLTEYKLWFEICNGGYEVRMYNKEGLLVAMAYGTTIGNAVVNLGMSQGGR